VPLVIVSPADHGRPPAAVTDFVSLRDIPTTIANIAHPATKSPFAGRSLLPPAPIAAGARAELDDVMVLSELASPNPSDPNQGRSPAYRGPLISLAAGDFVYIRNEGDGGEELFNQREDPAELNNLARAEGMLPVLRRFRDRVPQAKARAPVGTVSGGPPKVAATPIVP
jgi:hypothetical protein